MSEHTPERLEIDHNAQGDDLLGTKDAVTGFLNTVAIVPNRNGRDVWSSPSEKALRMQACWNACAGIQTAALEGADVKALVDAIRKFQAHHSETTWKLPLKDPPEHLTCQDEVDAALVPFLKGDSDEQ